MNYDDLTPGDILYLLMTGQVTPANLDSLSDHDIYLMELEAMDALAAKQAGGEYLVHWTASEEYH